MLYTEMCWYLPFHKDKPHYLSLIGLPLKGALILMEMEYSKVQWPKKEEIVNSTLWVIVMSLVLSVYLGVFDLIASRLLKVLVSLFGG